MNSIDAKEYEAIVGRLKKARRSSGLSQKEVADSLKKPQSYISKIESGERRIAILELKRLAVLYKKDIKYFIG
jgi:transcriptional regulator with XRE-family HTH domain